MKAVILSAGLGTRLRPLTEVVPKALVPVLHRPALLRVADRLRAAGVGTLCVNTHHLAGQVVEALAGRDALLSHEPVILGSGGGVAGFRDRLEEEDCFLVHNCDVFSDLDLGRLVEDHRRSGAAATLALVEHAPTDKVSSDRQGRITGFGGGPGPLLTYSGVAVLSPLVFRHLEPGAPSSLVDAFRSLLRSGECVRAHRQPDAWWTDLGHLASYLALHRDLLTGRAPWPGDEPPGPWSLEPGAEVSSTAVLEGWGCVSAGAFVGAGARLRDCVVWPHAHVVPGTSASSSVIGSFGICRL